MFLTFIRDIYPRNICRGLMQRKNVFKFLELNNWIEYKKSFILDLTDQFETINKSDYNYNAC